MKKVTIITGKQDKIIKKAIELAEKVESKYIIIDLFEEDLIILNKLKIDTNLIILKNLTSLSIVSNLEQIAKVAYKFTKIKHFILCFKSNINIKALTSLIHIPNE